jgi:molybdenum cofactor guanylyltransferase
MGVVAPIPVVIIAGGQGNRIGGDKTARLLSGHSLLDHMMEKARLYSDQIAVAVGRKADIAGHPDIELLEDDPDINGPIAGLLSALNFGRRQGNPMVLTLPCDTPFLPSDLLAKLVASLGKANVSLARCNGGLHPTCALWRVDAAAQLSAYVAQGRRSLIGFAEAIGYAATDWAADPLDPFFNINTPDDLTKAEEAVTLFPVLTGF